MVLPLIYGWRVGASESNLDLMRETLNCSTLIRQVPVPSRPLMHAILRNWRMVTESQALPLPQPSDAENLNRQKKRGSSKQAKQNAKAAWGKLLSQCSQIVDYVIALFRVDFTGWGELADRQQKLAQMLSRLTKIAEEFNVIVYMTNQVIVDPGGEVFISYPKKLAGRHVLAHAAAIMMMFRKGKGEQRVCKVIDAPNLRLMFRKGKGEQRVCKVFDAPNLPEAEAVFQITLGGIADAKN